MNTPFLSSIEEAVQWLATADQADPRNALRAAREQEFEERERQRAAAEAAASDPRRQHLYEAEGGPDLAAGVGSQHWAAPYNNDYLIVTFPPDAAFKSLDVLALSAKADLSFDDLKAADTSRGRQGVLEIVQPLRLKGGPWLTAIPVSEAKAGGDLYLHCFYVAMAQPGEGNIARKVARRKIAGAGAELPPIPNPHNVHGVAQVAHPGIPPHLIPDDADDSTPAAAAQVAASAGLPYTRLFLSLSPASSGLAPWNSWVVINVELAPGYQPSSTDFIGLSTTNPPDPSHPYTYQYVNWLDDGAYTTSVSCNLSDPTVGDLATLEKLYVFYGNKVNGQWGVVGNAASYKMQKYWMAASRLAIGQKRLHEIVIPGAHDAGTYDLVAPGAALNAQAQNLSFYGQLQLGVRYFDCRLYPSSGTYYFYHGKADSFTEIKDLTNALTDFFVSDNSRDIVILDFCRFSEFAQTDYDTLFNIFRSNPLFANAMMTPEEAKHLTFNELFARGKRLLILCENETVAAKYNLGRSINLDSQWAQAHDTTPLKSWLDEQVRLFSGKGEMWSLQAVLTPRGINSLSSYAVEVFPFLHGWLVNEWWDKANVVFCDFTAGTDVINAVKLCNQKRGNVPRGDIYWFEQPGWQTGNALLGVEVGKGGWTAFKSVFASSEGMIYAIDWESVLKRYHDANWQRGVPISHGGVELTTQPGVSWNEFRQVFAASDGWLYAIAGDYMNAGTGKLWRWHDTGGTSLAPGIQKGAGWEIYKFAFASSGGFLYAIDSNGKLWRYHDTGDNSALSAPTQISSGWENYKTAFATNNGVIYGVDWKGNLWWWQDTGGATLGAGKQIGTGWDGFRMIFATSDGRFYGIKD
jgi:hypothetical protein